MTLRHVEVPWTAGRDGGIKIPLENALYVSSRRSFTIEYTVEVAHHVIDSDRIDCELLRDLDINGDLLGRWGTDERRRPEAAALPARLR